MGHPYGRTMRRGYRDQTGYQAKDWEEKLTRLLEKNVSVRGGQEQRVGARMEGEERRDSYRYPCKWLVWV